MNNTTPITKWVKRIGSIVAVVALLATQSQAAFARILFEDDDYFNVNSEGLILDFNDNVDPGVASSLVDQTVTYTADNTGVAGDDISITIVETAAADLGGDSATITVTAVGNAITVTFQNDTNANPESVGQQDIVECLNTATGGANFTTGSGADAGDGIDCTITNNVTGLITASGGTATTDIAALTSTDLAGGVNGGDIEFQFGNDGIDASITYNESVQDLVISTPGGDVDFTDENLTTTGALLFQNSSEFHIRETSDYTTAACTTVGEIILDTSSNFIYICTATGAPGTWSNSSSAFDFDDVYDQSVTNTNLTMEIDNGTLNFNITGADSFAIQDGGANIAEFTGAGAVNFDPTSGQDFTITTAGIGDLVVNSSDDINFDAATFNLDTTGAFSLDGVGASNITTDTGNLTLNTTTSGDVDITGADNVDVSSTAGDITLTAGDDVIFDDAQLTGIVQLTDTATDWDSTFSGNGIIDNINSFTSTANGEGASNVGIEDASAWFTGAEIEAALNEIEALFGSTTSATYNFTEDNVLADNDSVYPALNKLDLKWGDLASTANGEGASLVGIEDAGTYYTGTTVEAALQEIGADLSNNYEDLTFYPEYPDTVAHADGTNNKGTLESLYDATEESGYYHWTANNAATQDVDLRFAFPMPTDFSATGDFLYRYRTGTVTEADNDVEVVLYNVTDATTCASDLTNTTAAVWATGTITAASINGGCTLDAGDIVEVRIKFYDVNGGTTYADIGRLIWNYTK